jgi:CHAT domain-containing protein
VSHWHVDDAVTARLVPDIILAARATPGLSRAEALRRAELAVLDDPLLDAADPAAWAPLVLVGDPPAGHRPSPSAMTNLRTGCSPARRS